jgi:hypothetical protein
MVTISVGVAVFPNHGGSPQELMAAADAAFSAAKRVGRDPVAVASPRVTEDSTVSGETVATAGRAGSFPRAEFLELPEPAFALHFWACRQIE